MKRSRAERDARRARRRTQRRMWIGLAVVGLVIITAGVIWQAGMIPPPGYTPEVTGGPRISVDQDYIDYGFVHFNTTIQTVFEVTNVGDKPLIIAGAPQVEVAEGC